MRLIYHPSARRDVRGILDYYDQHSTTAGDRFFNDLQEAEQRLQTEPTHHHFIHGRLRRCNLKQFPFHLVFEIVSDQVRVLTVRHHQRHPDFGLKRRWK